MSRSGADLALLLVGGFRALVDAAIVDLARRGYEDVRPVHDFAMRAIAAGAGSASELGRRLSISKQSAAKTIAVLQERGCAGQLTLQVRDFPVTRIDAFGFWPTPLRRKSGECSALHPLAPL